MTYCLVYYPEQDRTTKLIGTDDIGKELPKYLAMSDPELAYLYEKETVSDEELTALGIHIVLFDKDDNYVVIFVDDLKESYSGVFSNKRQVLEDAHIRRYGTEASSELYKMETAVLAKKMKAVKIIPV